MSHLLSNYELRVLYEYLSEDLSPPAHILTLRNRLRLSLQQPTNPLGHGIVPDAHQNWANFQVNVFLILDSSYLTSHFLFFRARLLGQSLRKFGLPQHT